MSSSMVRLLRNTEPFGLPTQGVPGGSGRFDAGANREIPQRTISAGTFFVASAHASKISLSPPATV